MVEPQLGTRKALERSLEGLGLRSRSVISGAQAQRETQHWRPDLILINVTLPDQSGLELCRALQQSPGGALRVVLLGEVETAAAHAAGASGTLNLPLDLGELSHLLQTFFDIKRPEALPANHLALLEQLLKRPGVIAITTYTPQGDVQHTVGPPLPEDLGQQAGRYLASARWLADSSEASVPALRGEGLAARSLGVIQVEYGERCLLMFEHTGGLTACLLRDSSSASLMKFWLRSADTFS